MALIISFLNAKQSIGDEYVILIVIAPALSLLVTSGFTQAMVNRALHAASRGDPKGAFLLLRRIGGPAVGTVLVFGLVIVTLGFTLSDASASVLADLVLIYLLLSLVWLGIVWMTISGCDFSATLSLSLACGVGLVTFYLCADQGLEAQAAFRLAVISVSTFFLIAALLLTRRGLSQQIKEAPLKSIRHIQKTGWCSSRLLTLPMGRFIQL